MNQQDSELVARLQAAIPSLPRTDHRFAQGICEAQERYGSLTDGRRTWARKLIDRANGAQEAVAARTVGDLSGILALFGKAKTHLKFPAIELSVPGYAAEQSIHVSIAGERAKEPGSLTVLSCEKYDTGKEFPERRWFGRITLAGVFVPGRKLDDQYRDAILTRLRAFAVDPSKVGGEDGRLHGRCCFCRKALSDERSTAAGFGAKCAKNFGLVWGAKAAEFAGKAA